MYVGLGIVGVGEMWDDVVREFCFRSRKCDSVKIER